MLSGVSSLPSSISIARADSRTPVSFPPTPCQILHSPFSQRHIKLIGARRADRKHEAQGTGFEGGRAQGRGTGGLLFLWQTEGCVCCCDCTRPPGGGYVCGWTHVQVAKKVLFVFEPCSFCSHRFAFSTPYLSWSLQAKFAYPSALLVPQPFWSLSNSYLQQWYFLPFFTNLLTHLNFPSLWLSYHPCPQLNAE